jgi:hypothetical protein
MSLTNADQDLPTKVCSLWLLPRLVETLVPFFTGPAALNYVYFVSKQVILTTMRVNDDQKEVKNWLRDSPHRE